MTKEKLRELRLNWIAAEETYEGAMRAWAQRDEPKSPQEAARWRSAWDEMEDLRRSAEAAKATYNAAAVAYVRTIEGPSNES
jgi:hypothetical protein